MKRLIAISFFILFFMAGLGVAKAQPDACPPPDSPLEEIEDCFFNLEIKVTKLAAVVHSGGSRLVISGSINRNTHLTFSIDVTGDAQAQIFPACSSLAQDATKGPKRLVLIGVGDYVGLGTYLANINSSSSHSVSCELDY